MTPKPLPSATLVAKLRAAVEQAPEDAKARLKLGTALLKRGQVNHAEVELRRSVELDPKLVAAWVNLGGLLLTRWNFEGCVEANKSAVECDPSLFEPQYNLGLGYLYLGKAAEMVPCFRRVTEIDPEHAGGHYHLAVGLLALGEAEEARTHLGTAMSLGWRPEPALVKALEKQGNACTHDHAHELVTLPSQGIPIKQDKET